MIFIQEIDVSGVKSGFKLPVKMKIHNLIVGKNGSGKTAIVNAVELVLTGKASDIFGRDEVAATQQIMSISNNRDSLKIKGKLSDDDVGAGETVSWSTVSNGSGGFKAPNHEKPPVKCKNITREIRKVFEGSADTIKMYLLSRYNKMIERMDIIPFLETAERIELYKDITLNLFGTETQMLLDAEEVISKKIREMSADIKFNDAIVRNYAIADLPSKTEVSKMYENANRKIKSKEEFSREFEATAFAISDCESVVASLKSEYAKKRKTKQTVSFGVVNISKFTKKMNAEVCMVCNSALTEKVLAGMQALEDKFKNGSDEFISGDDDNYTIGFYSSKLEDLTLKMNLLKAEEKASEVSNFSALDKLIEYERKLAIDSIVSDAKKKIEFLTNEIKRFKELNECIGKVIDYAVKKCIQHLSREMQKLLPTRDYVGVEIDGDKVKIGFRKNGYLNTALSGAEWARLTMAASVVLAEPAIFNIVIPEERAFDPQTLSDVMEALDICPFQVILCSPVHPEREHTAWNIIDTSTLEKSEIKVNNGNFNPHAESGTATKFPVNIKKKGKTEYINQSKLFI